MKQYNLLKFIGALPLLLSLLTLFGCKKNYEILQNVNQLGGVDLYDQLSQQERILIGTWYFSHEVFVLSNGMDSVSTESMYDYGSQNQTDSIRFYSTKFVGSEQYCPFIAPDSLKESLKAQHSFTNYMDICSPDNVSGWFIRNNILINYTGSYNGGGPSTMNYLNIIQLNNDSLVFEYDDQYAYATYTLRKPVFKKL
jgi:hypothetical protein